VLRSTFSERRDEHDRAHSDSGHKRNLAHAPESHCGELGSSRQTGNWEICCDKKDSSTFRTAQIRSERCRKHSLSAVGKSSRVKNLNQDLPTTKPGLHLSDAVEIHRWPSDEFRRTVVDQVSVPAHSSYFARQGAYFMIFLGMWDSRTSVQRDVASPCFDPVDINRPARPSG
jgi:hypothetical protein